MTARTKLALVWLFVIAIAAGCRRPQNADTKPDAPTPGPDLTTRLTQKGQVGDYQLSLPPEYTAIALPAGLPPHLQMGSWIAKTPAGQPLGAFSVAVMSDTSSVNSAASNMGQMLVNFSAGVTDASGCPITTRGLTLTSVVNGLQFSRFAFSGTAPNNLAMKGVTAGALDGARVVAIVGTGFGADADGQVQLFEAVVATIKKR